MPARTRLRPGLLAHLHLHAGAQRRSQSVGPTAEHRSARRMSRTGQEAILDSLRRTVEGLRWQPSGHWVQYGRQTSYSEAGAASKREHVERMVAASRARTVEAVSGLLNLVMLPMWLLSGVFFASSNFPEAMQPAIHLLPLTALNDGLRAVMLEGTGPSGLAGAWAVLTAWGAITFPAALWLFRWR